LTTISTVILSWESPEDTITCTESVIKACKVAGLHNSPITIVDNGSSQATVSALENWHKRADTPSVSLILNPMNAGFSAGMNIGIRHSRGLVDSDYIWLLNNDLHVAPEAVKALLDDAQQRENVVIWGPTVVSARTRKVECAGGCRYFPLIGYSRSTYSGIGIEVLKNKSLPKMDYIYGAAMLLKADFLNRVNDLDERYFLYYEELELAQRVAPHERFGWSRDSIVYHVGAGSSSLPGVEREKTKQAALSAFRYTRRYHPHYLFFVFLARFFGILARGITKLKPQLPLAVLEATKQFMGEIKEETPGN
jgi:GT2 family glycosyltransferase